MKKLLFLFLFFPSVLAAQSNFSRHFRVDTLGGLNGTTLYDRHAIVDFLGKVNLDSIITALRLTSNLTVDGTVAVDTFTQAAIFLSSINAATTGTFGGTITLTNAGDAGYINIQGISDGDNFSAFALKGTGTQQWQFANKATGAFSIGHNNGTSWSFPFAITLGDTINLTTGLLNVSGNAIVGGRFYGDTLSNPSGPLVIPGSLTVNGLFDVDSIKYAGGGAVTVADNLDVTGLTRLIQQTTATATFSAGAQIGQATSGTIADGFGAGLSFVGSGAASSKLYGYGNIVATRDGSDSTTYFAFAPSLNDTRTESFYLSFSTAGSRVATFGSARGVGDGLFYAGDSLFIGSTLFADANRSVAITGLSLNGGSLTTTPFSVTGTTKLNLMEWRRPSGSTAVMKLDSTGIIDLNSDFRSPIMYYSWQGTRKWHISYDSAVAGFGITQTGVATRLWFNSTGDLGINIPTTTAITSSKFSVKASNANANIFEGYRSASATLGAKLDTNFTYTGGNLAFTATGKDIGTVIVPASRIFIDDTIRAGDYTTYSYFIPGGLLVTSSDSSTKYDIRTATASLANFGNVVPREYKFKKQNFLRQFDESSVPDSIDVQENDSTVVRRSNKTEKDAARTEFYYRNNQWAKRMSQASHSGFLAQEFNQQLFGKPGSDIRQEDINVALWLKVQELEARIKALEAKK